MKKQRALRGIAGYYGVMIPFHSRALRVLGAWQQASRPQGASPGPGERPKQQNVGRNPANRPRGGAWRHRRAATGAAISQHEREALHRRNKNQARFNRSHIKIQETYVFLTLVGREQNETKTKKETKTWCEKCLYVPFMDR